MACPKNEQYRKPEMHEEPGHEEAEADADALARVDELIERAVAIVAEIREIMATL